MNQETYQKITQTISQIHQELKRDQETRENLRVLDHLEQAQMWLQAEYEAHNRDIIAQFQQQLVSANRTIWVLLNRVGGESLISTLELEEADNPKNSISWEPNMEDNTIKIKALRKL